MSADPSSPSTGRPDTAIAGRRAPRDAGGEGQAATADKEFLATLAKGLTVLASFGEQRPTMTLSQAAAVAGLSRATARRVLRTLVQLGYVVHDGRSFSLAPRILELGFAFLSTQSWIDRAVPLMEELSRAVQEPCSAAILQDTEIVYVARTPAPERIMATAIAIGAHQPAFHTALGRIQLGFLSEKALWSRLKAASIAPLTPATITDLSALFERIRADRQQGFSIVDEELEHGLRAIAVPIIARDGRIVAAMELSTHSDRTTRNALREDFLPSLRGVAEAISQSLP